MTWRIYLPLFLIGLVTALAVACLQSVPGYMDADYYYVGGLQLVNGHGFNEPFLWNYLDDPAGLPHPSHTYWMPLASIVAAIGMFLTGQLTYAAARLGFILIAACIPPLTAALAYKLTSRQDLALVSGLLAPFSIYHAPFMSVTDNFGINMLLGGLLCILLARSGNLTIFMLGAVAGLLNLARSDGLLWFGMILFFIFFKMYEDHDGSPLSVRTFISFARKLIPAVVGYLLVMAPWFWRNLSVFGRLMAPGGGHLLWLKDYNETFIYPASQLTFESWLQAGWRAALFARLSALKWNLLNAFAAQGGIVLFPFILLGLWQLRRDIRTRLVVVAWLVLLAVMTLVFPFAGQRGGFFHAGAAFQPFWWSVAPLGLDSVIIWTRRRGWFTPQAFRIFRLTMIGLVFTLTILLVLIRVVVPGWGKDETHYAQIEQVLLSHDAKPDEIAFVRNPPGYFIVNGRSTIVVPDGDEHIILEVANRYHARYLVLEKEGVLLSLKDLYDHPQDHPLFRYLGEIHATRIFAIETQP